MLYRRTACLNKFGYSCQINKDKSCPTPYENITEDCSPSNNSYSDHKHHLLFLLMFYNALPPVAQ